MNQVQILVLDFGSQYTQLIARRLREFGVYTEIVPYFETIQSIRAKNPKGIILSGGPASVYEEGAYMPDSEIFNLGIPVLGICYGMQYIAHHFGGKVVRAKEQEFGKAKLEIIQPYLSTRQTHKRHFVISSDTEGVFTTWKKSFFAAHGFMDTALLERIALELQQRIQDFQNLYVDSIHHPQAFGIYRTQGTTCHFECYLIDRTRTQQDITRDFLATICTATQAQHFETQWDKHDKKGVQAFIELGFTQGKSHGDMLELHITRSILESKQDCTIQQSQNLAYEDKTDSRDLQGRDNENSKNRESKGDSQAVRFNNQESTQDLQDTQQYLKDTIGASSFPSTSHHCKQKQTRELSQAAMTKDECEQSSILAQETTPLFAGVKQDSIVWMSHADKVEEIPQGFSELAKSGNTHYCAIADCNRQIYALQFHPEVVHSECGGEILKNFAVKICHANTDWNMKNFIAYEIEKIRKITGIDSQSHQTSQNSQELFYTITDSAQKEQIFTLWQESFTHAHSFMSQKMLQHIAKSLKWRIRDSQHFLAQRDSNGNVRAFGFYIQGCARSSTKGNAKKNIKENIGQNTCVFECYVIDRSFAQEVAIRAFLTTLYTMETHRRGILSFITQWDRHDKKGLKVFEQLGFERGEVSGDMVALRLDSQKVAWLDSFNHDSFRHNSSKPQ